MIAKPMALGYTWDLLVIPGNPVLTKAIIGSLLSLVLWYETLALCRPPWSQTHFQCPYPSSQRWVHPASCWPQWSLFQLHGTFSSLFGWLESYQSAHRSSGNHSQSSQWNTSSSRTIGFWAKDYSSGFSSHPGCNVCGTISSTSSIPRLVGTTQSVNIELGSLGRLVDNMGLMLVEDSPLTHVCTLFVRLPWWHAKLLTGMML